MKYIKNFKLFETGEWDYGVDLNYVKNNPDDDSEEAAWIKWLNEQLELIIDDLDNKNIFEIIDIEGFDIYQGPYATVKIFDRNYKIWTNVDNDLFIENFPINNNSENGYVGEWSDISDMLNDVDQFGGVDLYMAAEKYNL